MQSHGAARRAELPLYLPELPTMEASMKHPALRWNPELEEWFCPRCGLTSDCSKREDAEAELNLLFECELPVDEQLARGRTQDK